MPRQYVAMRDAFKKKGMSDKAAKAKAAAIYNSDPEHKSHPVGRYSEAKESSTLDSLKDRKAYFASSPWATGEFDIQKTDAELDQERSKVAFEKSRVANRKSIKSIRAGEIERKFKDPVTRKLHHKQLDRDFSDVKEEFATFMEKRWEKPNVSPDEIFAHYGKTRTSTSSKNARTPEARKAAMDKVRTPVRRVKLGEQLVGGGGNEGNEQGIGPASPTTATTTSLKKPKPPEKAIKKPDEIKPVDTTMKEEFCKFMEDRAERLYQDAKHSGKNEKGRGAGGPQRRMAPLHIKHYGEWPDEVAKDAKDKAMKHGYRQAVKRDIAKAVEESFKAAQAKIASKEGVSKERAGAILAASSRHASAAAKRKNPKLKKVKG